jgi:hypothetical protein
MVVRDHEHVLRHVPDPVALLRTRFNLRLQVDLRLLGGGDIVGDPD